MMSLRHLPKILIVSMLALTSRSTIEPPDRMDHAVTPSGLKPTCVPAIYSAFLSDLVISVILMAYHLFLWYTSDKGMWLLDPCCRKCATWHRISTISHTLVWPISMFLIDSPLTLFFD